MTFVGLKPQEVKDIAQLARLQVSEEETEKFFRDLNQILEYVEQLGEVDRERVRETFYPISQETPLRQDSVKPSFTQREASMNAPDKKDGCFRVPKVIG
jgi:aspartyl-tRNA(Asn)/glutamyl-tRNA(Gln) amidotransferase subunit C